MKEPFLEVTFPQCRAIAAYYNLPRRAGATSYRMSVAAPGILIDSKRSGKAIGIEVTAPSRISLAAPNRPLRDLGIPPLKRADIAPLRAT